MILVLLDGIFGAVPKRQLPSLLYKPTRKNTTGESLASVHKSDLVSNYYSLTITLIRKIQIRNLDLKNL